MAKKIYIQGNYIIIENSLDSSDDKRNLISNVYVEKNGELFIFYKLSNDDIIETILFTDILDENGNAYSDIETFTYIIENRIGSFEGKNEFKYEVSLNRIDNASIVNKFGYNADIDTANEEIIASFGGSFDPNTYIITVAQTFTITYNNTTDGLGQTGATKLRITYLDENYLEQNAVHVLGNTGSDVTSFSGLGINRVVVLSNGGIGSNTNNITITATTDATTQAMIPALSSVTQQCIFHTQIGFGFMIDYIFVNALKLFGGGGSPRITIKGYSYSRVTETFYKIITLNLDTSVENHIDLSPSIPLYIGGREVVYFTASTDKDNTEVNLRFSGVSMK